MKLIRPKVFIVLLIGLLFFFFNCQSGPEFCDSKIKIKSSYLKNPEKLLKAVRLSADFWKASYDSEFGGYFTNVKNDGTPDKLLGLKTILTQSRNAFGFAKAYMLTGDNEYLEYTRHAISFMDKYAWDKENGGFHTCMDRKGNSIDDTTQNQNANIKWSFMQHYALLGITAAYEAAHMQSDYDLLIKAREVIDLKLWDFRPEYKGYYDTAAYNWSRPRGKGFTPTVDCITTHGLSLYLITDDEQAKTRLFELGDNIIDHIIPTMEERKLGFAENFSSDWLPSKSGHLFVGHVLKTAWCLGRIYLINPKSVYIEAAEKLMQEVWEKAWDKENGGPYETGNSNLGTLNTTEKGWWTLEQAVTSGMILYYITGNSLYLQMADSALDFFMKYLVDWKYGEAYATVSADGKKVVSSMKGDYWKAGYHTIETFYYVYLYSNLYLQGKPATLYYYFDATDKEQVYKLTPCSIEDSKLEIDSVLYEGKAYENFDRNTRKIIIEKGLAGEFEVTFIRK